MSENQISQGNGNISKTLLRSLYEQRSERSFCDVKLTVEDSEVWCHACVMASSSIYFQDLLQTRQSHWCFRNPLEINIGQQLGLHAEICTVCIIKIIDSMYLKKLVVAKEHLEHFPKIVEFFKVVDLLPLCEKYLSHRTEEPKGKKEVTSKSLDTLIKERQVVTKQRETPKTSLDTEKFEKVQLESSLTKENEETVSKSLKATTALIGGKVKTISVEDVLSKSEMSSDHTYIFRELENNQKCEFVCCNSNATPAPNNKECQSEKRVLRCEVCTFSSISARKMMKHIESSKHFANTCAICCLKFPDVDLARDHIKDHMDKKLYMCHICKKRNRYWENHKLHYKVHCKSKEFQCEICKKSFRLKKYLNEHMKFHEIYLNEGAVSIGKGKTISKETSDAHILNKLVHSNEKPEKRFYCKICNEGFTRKKNLMRHSSLKHMINEYLKCSGCNYQTKRSDLLTNHMKKYHKELVVEKTLKPKPKKTNKQNNSSIVGVMIPVQLVSTTDSSALNGYVVEKNEEATRKLQKEQNETNSDIAQVQLNCSPVSFSNNIFTSSLSGNNMLYTEHEECSASNTKITNPTSKMNPETNIEGMAGSLSEVGKEDFERMKNSSLSGIWLNEATGELLNESTFLNVHLVDSPRIETNFHATTENSLLDLKTPLQALILNEISNGLPLLDFADETDNPQTPQTNMVELEEADNLISWNYLDANFYSTWVLNEATGELNMVSFNMQPFKHSESLQVDENTGRTPADDDDTALFLNEGTGDLSVIYFNPNKCHHETAEQPSDQTNQEDQDNMSEHSNDDKDDLLNEEFLIASANFMAYEENETFLNELTGEFNTTNLGQFQSRNEDNKPENMYLNEETGEICWNILDKNIGRDFFTNSENLNFDFDESLNYEDFDLAEDINDFQFQSSFGLDPNIPSDWPEEPCGTLLNECTGEFVTRE